jgi:N-acetylmuramoyl-L-alanine amidase
MATPASAAGDVGLMLDGSEIICDTAPVIDRGRTLVPVRALFESLGAQVMWDPAEKLVSVSYSNTAVHLVIGKSTARVNGKDVSMDVPAAILSGNRTYIPVRFVAESLGFGVDWDDSSRTVLLRTPEDPAGGSTVIESITCSSEAGLVRTAVVYTGIAPDCRTAAYESPDRFVVDVRNAQVNVGAVAGGSGTIPGDNVIFSQIRYAQFEEGTVRMVFDLLQRQTAQLTVDAAEGFLYIDFTDPEIVEEEKPSGESEEEGGEANDIDIPALDWRMSDQRIVIDAGHGGKDPGCLVVDGGVTYYEKDFNLRIALALEKYLKEAGAKTYMLRTSDETLALQERPVLANELGADLFLSVHNNSANSAAPKGSQVFYYSKATEEAYAVGSKILAQHIL